MAPKILTLTMNPAIDAFSSVDRVVPDRKLRCREPRFDPGGGGINVSRAVVKLGGGSLALFPAGGPHRQTLERLLEAEGVDFHTTPIAGATRENLTVVEAHEERHYRFGMPGPELSPEEWRGCLDTIASLEPAPDFLVASGSLPRGVPVDFYARLARTARSRGGRLVVDASGDALRAAAEEGVYLLKPNMRELAELAGRSIEDEETQDSVAGDLVGRGRAEVVVVSLGAAGVLLVTGSGRRRLRAPSVPVRSKVGAGDSMMAGIVLALSRGDLVLDAVGFGVAAGASAVMTPGTELCTREGTERLHARMRHDRA